MPASYAHLSFGQSVLRAIPDEETKTLIQKHIELFKIGLLGPDILFFYHPLSGDPINRLGHALHYESGAYFLGRECCLRANEKQTAYLLGFICHYVLDSECHTLVEYYMEKTGREHSTIETDLERVLMIRDGLDPFRYFAASSIHVRAGIADVIAPFYEVTPKVIKKAIISMRHIGRLLTPSSPLKHRLLTKIGKRMGESSIVSQLTMDRIPDPIFTESNHAIAQRMERAIPVAVALVVDFLAWQRGEAPLSRRFQPNFSFDPEELARLKERNTRV